MTIDHEFTDELVCPYCGHKHLDSWDVSDDSGDFECHECGREFDFVRDVSITYSTSPKASNEDIQCSTPQS